MRWLGLVLVAGCRVTSSSTNDPPDARESPQASAQPAQLAPLPVASAPPAPLESGTSPAPFRADEVLAPDAPAATAVGYTLSAAFRQEGVLGPVRAPEVNPLGLDQARRLTELRLAIDVLPTRMRVAFAGHGFVLPDGSEIRARADRYGHVFVGPGATAYRPLAPGSFRALLGERRFDVAPIAPAEIAQREEGGRRIGIRMRKAEVTTRAAKATFEVGRLDGMGEGGVLLCRLLLDLVNAPPGTALCGTDELPVRAELHWTTRGSLTYELTGYVKRADVPVTSLLVPPPTAALVAAPLAPEAFAPLLGPSELAALRINDVDVPAAGDALAILNATLELRILYLDGIPVARVAPGGRGELRGLHRGRYVAQWRTFLGDGVDAPTTQVAPGVASVGVPVDAGYR